MPADPTLTTAKRSRSQFANVAKKAIDQLYNNVSAVIAEDPLSLDAIEELEAYVEPYEKRLQDFAAAQAKVEALELGDNGEESDDPYAGLAARLTDMLDRAKARLTVARRKILAPPQQPVQNAGAIQVPGNATVRAPNPNVVAPKTLQEDISLSAFDEWVKTWEDYVSVTEADRYPQPRQLGLFRGFLSPEMRNTLTHILNITQDSKDTPLEVIAKLRTHIREERNIIRDLVAFDVRKQKPDEPFNTFLVNLKQIAQDAGLDDCQNCYQGS